MTTQVRPQMIDGNMVFFGHSINLVKEDYYRCHSHLRLRDDYVVTVAYTFPSENFCLAAASVKQPQDKYVRKVGNHLAFCRLAEASEAYNKFEPLPKHCVVVDSHLVVSDRRRFDQRFATIPQRLFGNQGIQTLIDSTFNHFSSVPVKQFRHDVVQSALLIKLIESDRAVRKAFEKVM